MQSIWEREGAWPRFPTLTGDRSTDVLIIGGGITGVLCAYMLRRAGVDCLLVEAGRLGGGVTKNTTAKLTHQPGLIYADTLRRFGREAARRYLTAQEAALSRYRALAAEIDCDLEECDAYVYTRRDREALAREAAALASLGRPATIVEGGGLSLPFPTAGAIRVTGQAQLHPLKLLFGLARDLPILENTRVLSCRKNTVLTEGGCIRARRVVVATHFPFLNRHGSYFLKMYQARSYVLVLEGTPLLDGVYTDAQSTGLSLRRYRDLLIVSGGGGRTGKENGGWAPLTRAVKRYWPNAREVCRFANQDCMTLDGLPYIGRYAAHTDGLYVATGFQQWGMGSAMLAATLLTDLLTGRENEVAPVLSPSRSILRPQLGVNVWETVCSLLSPRVPRCPHMGCTLHYNRAEHSWDCPCHGSRFAEDGRLLENPSTKRKKHLPQ